MAETSDRLCFDLGQSPFFCDGHGYLLTSQSLGGCSLEEFCQAHNNGTERDRKALLRRGVYLPLLFNGDCMLDDALIVMGDLTPEEASTGVNLLTWKLNIPCGKLLLCCGGGDEEDIRIAVNEEREAHYHPFELFPVPPGQYLTELYATPQRFIIRLSPLTTEPTMPPIEDGWIDLPNLGDVFEGDEDDDQD